MAEVNKKSWTAYISPDDMDDRFIPAVIRTSPIPSVRSVKVKITLEKIEK